jgi:hypothetical protein
MIASGYIMFLNETRRESDRRSDPVDRLCHHAADRALGAAHDIEC